MLKLWKHISAQPFVFTTGLAALVHSTWSLGTLFAGGEPQPQFSPSWFAWVVPALLIAFSLDVGQIVTSAEIRAGQRTRAKYMTFMVFAVATYYLQWLYIAHHMPSVDLAPGVRESWGAAAALLRDAAVWFIPALLPVSTLLYTFSHSAPETTPTGAPVHSAEPDAALPALATPIVSEGAALPALIPVSATATVDPRYVCPACGYTNTYTSVAAAAQGKRAHERHCKGRFGAPVPEPEFSSNGHGHS